MKVQFLVSALNEDVETLPVRMKLQADAIVINQCDENTYRQVRFTDQTGRMHLASCYSFAERGVGLSRNNALMRANADLCVFADEDIVYRNGGAAAIVREFEKNPAADMILFNVDVPKERRTYHIDAYGRVRRYNCGRYPTYSFAARTEKLHEANLSFSLLFGGGARYSNGEDSLFLAECIRKGLKVYKAPVTIGAETGRPSTWFHGYDEKFFYDRGVLYHYLYRGWAVPFALRFLLKNRKTMLTEMSFRQAFSLLCMGIRRRGYASGKPEEGVE